MQEPAASSIPEAPPKPGNRYGRTEWAGAFGDLGTLLPFVVAYLAVVKMDPLGVLLAFGVSMIAIGLYYRTPVPVQPMKAIGAAAAAQTSVVVTPQAVAVAGLATGLVWLFLALTGLADKVSRIVPRPISVGIILGLGFAFMLEGLKMMATGWLVAGVGLALTLLLLTNRRIPAMFVLLLFGAAVALYAEPDLAAALGGVEARFRLPVFSLSGLTWNDVLVGVAILAIPQLPLTFGNAIVAITEENNRLFPDRKITERKVSASTGIMNVLGASIGGVPMCHGAGGMAGHVRFGAQTGGAVLILGAILCVVALFFSDSASTLLRLRSE